MLAANQTLRECEAEAHSLFLYCSPGCTHIIYQYKDQKGKMLNDQMTKLTVIISDARVDPWDPRNHLWVTQVQVSFTKKISWVQVGRVSDKIFIIVGLIRYRKTRITLS